MGFLDKIFGIKKDSISKSNEQVNEHAVIIHFNYGIEGMEKIYELREKLTDIIDKNNLGEYDGHEIATDYGDGFLYMYGPNAETLFNGIKKTLEKTDFLNGATAKLRFGPPEDGIREITVEIKTE
jgi:hypothetical protein